MNGKWTEQSAVRRVIAAGGTVHEKTITVFGVGIGTWGAIDYLRRYHKYWVKR